jgi:hypothetical protein
LRDPHDVFRQTIRQDGLVHLIGDEADGGDKQQKKRDMYGGSGNKTRTAGGLVREHATNVMTFTLGADCEGIIAHWAHS